MRVMRDFKCRECNKVKETLIENTVQSIGCECGGKMEKMLSVPMVVLDGTDPSLPGAYEKWANDREKRYRKQLAKQ